MNIQGRIIKRSLRKTFRSAGRQFQEQGFDWIAMGIITLVILFMLVLFTH